MEILVNEGERAGELDHDQSEMIRNVLEFRDLTAGEAMVPRTRVTAFDIETAPSELLRLIAESGHSRYPVYRERIDNVVGMLHAKDLLSYAASHDELDLSGGRVPLAPARRVRARDPSRLQGAQGHARRPSPHWRW